MGGQESRKHFSEFTIITLCLPLGVRHIYTQQLREREREKMTNERIKWKRSLAMMLHNIQSESLKLFFVQF